MILVSSGSARGNTVGSDIRAPRYVRTAKKR